MHLPISDLEGIWKCFFWLPILVVSCSNRKKWLYTVGYAQYTTIQKTRSSPGENRTTFHRTLVQNGGPRSKIPPRKLSSSTHSVFESSKQNQVTTLTKLLWWAKQQPENSGGFTEFKSQLTELSRSRHISSCSTFTFKITASRTYLLRLRFNFLSRTTVEVSSHLQTSPKIKSVQTISFN